MNNISAFIDQSLKNHGNEAIPEIQALRHVIEDNPWHAKQSVFDHTKAVVEAFKKYTDNELLILATLFHDIAKPITFSQDEKTGMTMCFGHEKKGSEMMDVIGSRIGLVGKDLAYVKQIVKNHDAPHQLINKLMENNNDEAIKQEFFLSMGSIAKDLLIHALADMEGSNLLSLNPDLFTKRKILFEDLIKNCL